MSAIKRSPVNLVCIDKYVDVVGRAIALNAWHLVGVLRKARVNLRPTHLKKLLLATANGPKGQGNLHAADWEKLDAELETIAELLMHSIQDVHLAPLSKRHWTGQEKDEAVSKTLLEQARVATECLDLLPKDGAGFAREVDQADVHMREVSVRIYLKARQVLFDKVAEAANHNGLEAEAERYFGYLVESLNGPYGGIAGNALRNIEYLNQRSRVFVLRQLKLSSHLGFGGPHQDTFKVFGAKWATTIPNEQLVVFGKVQLVLGDNMPLCGMEELKKQAVRIARIWAAVRSFTGDFNRDWTVMSMDATTLNAILVREIIGLPEASFEINGVNRKTKEWKHDDDEVTLKLEMRKRNDPDTVLVKWEAVKPSFHVKT